MLHTLLTTFTAVEGAEHRILSCRFNKLYGTSPNRFAGVEPVQMGLPELETLQHHDYMVSLKLDGLRAMLWYASDMPDSVYIVLRNGDVLSLHVHNHTTPTRQGDTVIDCEVMLTTQAIPTFVALDGLIMNGQDVRQQNFMQRQTQLELIVVELQPLVGGYGLNCKRYWPINSSKDILACWLSASTDSAVDGLMFTRCHRPYKSPDAANVFKWKPPQQISVDFFLELRFPPICGLPNRPDLLATPLFILKVRRKHDLLYFDMMRMQDEEWERWKQSGEQLDDRIVEATWHEKDQNWEIVRIRDDKDAPNALATATAALLAVQANIDLEALVLRADLAARQKRVFRLARSLHELE